MKEFKQEVQLSIRGLKKSYGDAEILKGVNLDVRQGEVVVILGPSGSGKSTFLRSISGLKNSALPAVRQKLGMVFQSYDLFPHVNILDNITLAPTKVQKRSRKEAEAEARELLSRVNLADKEKAYPRMLSGGQKQRVAIVRALAMHPELMLFDEVTAALDPEMVREVLDVIMELPARRRSSSRRRRPSVRAPSSTIFSLSQRVGRKRRAHESIYNENREARKPPRAHGPMSPPGEAINSRDGKQII